MPKTHAESGKYVGDKYQCIYQGDPVGNSVNFKPVSFRPITVIEASIDKVNEAFRVLEVIAGYAQPLDNLMGNQELARHVLASFEQEEKRL